MRINPGSDDAPPGTAAQAAQNMQLFIEAVTDCGGFPRGDTIRLESDDDRGRFAFGIPGPGGELVRILMPGTPIEMIRDDRTASAPCVFVNGHAWWWRDAAGQTVHALNAHRT